MGALGLVRFNFKKVISFFMTLILFMSFTDLSCFAEKWKHKKIKDSYARKVYSDSIENDDDVGHKLKFSQKEYKRVFVGLYNEICRVSGLTRNLKNVNFDFYENDLLMVFAFIKSQKAEELYSEEEIIDLRSVLESVAEENEITL